jgi:hypothetical protein
MVGGALLMLVGLVLDLGLTIHWIARGGRLEEISYQGVLGLMLIILGFQTITSTLIMQMVLISRRRNGDRSYQR